MYKCIPLLLDDYFNLIHCRIALHILPLILSLHTYANLKTLQPGISFQQRLIFSPCSSLSYMRNNCLLKCAVPQSFGTVTLILILITFDQSKQFELCVACPAVTNLFLISSYEFFPTKIILSRLQFFGIVFYNTSLYFLNVCSCKWRSFTSSVTRYFNYLVEAFR